METINWDKAIARNREALLRIVAALFAMAGIAEGRVAATLPRRLRNQVLRILRPAESAVRRLVIIAARELVVVVKPRRSTTTTTSTTTGNTRTTAAQAGALSVIDPLPDLSFRPVRRRPKGFPRISVIGVSDPRPIPDDWIPSPDDPVERGRPWPQAPCAESSAGRPGQTGPPFRPLAGPARPRPHRTPRIRCVPAGRRATASGRCTKSTTCCANAIRWRITRSGWIRREFCHRLRECRPSRSRTRRGPTIPLDLPVAGSPI